MSRRLDRDQVGWADRSLGEIEDRWLSYRTIRECTGFAGDAQDREVVDEVRGDLELDDRVAEPFGQRSAFRRVRFEDHDPLVLLGEPELLF